jgi:alpha-beta hydrolase superfamily lysophospholipase
MKFRIPTIVALLFCFGYSTAALAQEVKEPETITIDSEDKLQITVDAYAPHTGDAPAILLCHQAGWSRGEYREIAPKLNELGFNCFAIDQRSGGEVNGIVNETNKRAKAEGKGDTFADAEQDMIAALKFVREKTTTSNGEQKIILWGSSYSSALSLRIAGEHPDLVDGVLAFAPGEYFKRFGKPGDWIGTSAKKIECPAFITSAKKEQGNWQSIYDAIPGDSKTMFLPETAGNHGSRALWEKFDDHEAYWTATKDFLAQFNEAADHDQDHEDHKHDDKQ